MDFFFTWTCVTSNIFKLIIKISGIELCPRGVSGLLRLDEGEVKVEEDHRVGLGKVSGLGGVSVVSQWLPGLSLSLGSLPNPQPLSARTPVRLKPRRRPSEA